MATGTPVTEPSITLRRGRTTAFWASTSATAAEAIVGGVLDLGQYRPYISILTDLGYPAYLATIIGPAKVASGVIVLAPGLPRLKEWAYAGILVNMLGAAASQVLAGRGLANVVPPLMLAAIAAVSWATRPTDRRLRGPVL